jgi:O-antigen/teichoic acid export membrane protein
MAASLLFLVPGSGQSYVYAYYKKNEASLDQFYTTGALGHYLLAVLVAAILAYWFKPLFMISIVLFLIQAPYFITEPMLRVRNYYALNAVGKGFSSLVTLAITGIWLLWRGPRVSTHLDLPTALRLMVIGNLIGYAIYYLIIGGKKYLAIKPLRILKSFGNGQSWARYYSILKIGVPLAVPGLVWLVFTYVDRLFIEHYRPATALSTYALAWQLSQSAILTLASLNIVSGVRIGEHMSHEPAQLRTELRHQFTRTVAASAISFTALIAGTFLLSRTVYRDYQNLVIITFMLSAGYIGYNIWGSVSSLLFYERRNLPMNLGHVLVLLVSLAGNILAIRCNLWYGVPVALTSIALIIFSIGFVIYVRNFARALPAGQRSIVTV